VFVETNGSQVEQVDLDELDDEEASCIALRNMSIGDVCPQIPEEPTPTQDQPSSLIQASPPTEDEEQAQEDEIKFKTMSHLKIMASIKGDMKSNKKRSMSKMFQIKAPHPRVHQAIQRDRHVDSIHGDIQKGVTTRSRFAHLCFCVQD
jgi:hypothetical protein